MEENINANKTAAAEAKPDEYMGKGKLRLRKPLPVDGKMLKAIPYDFDALTAEDIIEADKDRAKLGGSFVAYHQFDVTAQLCIFARAVEKEMPNCTLEDLKRMGGRDTQEALVLGRRFFTVDSEDGEDETSETE